MAASGSIGGEEAAHRRHGLEHRAGLQLLVGPGREGAAVDALDADPAGALALAGADRVAAAQLVVVELAAEGEVLALREVEEGGVLVARLQGDDDGVAGLLADVDDIEGMEACHSGCPCVRSDALEVVEGLEAVVAAVAGLAGRRAELADLRGVGRAAARAGDRAGCRPAIRLTRPHQPAVGGGAVDRRGDAVGASLSRPASLIQSVVQGGEIWRFSREVLDALVAQRLLDVEVDDRRGAGSRSRWA